MKKTKYQDMMNFRRILIIKLIILSFLLFHYGQSFAVSDRFPQYIAPPAVSDLLAAPNNTYYCSPSGDNDTGDGSIGKPWLDLIGAGSTVRAGDLIYLRGGNYPSYPYENFSRSRNRLAVSGNSTNPIVITNYPGEIVRYNSVEATWCLTLDGDHQKLIGTNVNNRYGIQITGGISIRGNDCQVSGVEFIGGTSNGGDLNPAMLSVPLNDGCDNLKITHCSFHDSKHQSSANRMAGIRFFTTSNSIIEYNIFTNNYELSDCACIYYKDSTKNSIVRYNTFINNSDGIEYFTQGNVHDGLSVYNNLFYNVEHPFSFRNETGPNIRVYNNVALAIPSGGSFFEYLNADPVVASERGEYYNNIIDGTGFSRGWHHNSSNANNLPSLFDYNLWYEEADRNGTTLWSLPSGYYNNSVTANNVVTIDMTGLICTVEDNYPGRNVGRNGSNIGGFTFGSAVPVPDDDTSEPDPVNIAAPKNLRFVTVARRTLFNENFDDADFSSRGWYDNTNLTISNAEHISSGSGSLEFRFRQGASVPDSGGAMRMIFDETEYLYVSYYVKYSTGWEGSNLGYHPHEFQILTNKDSNYAGPASTHLTTYIEQNEGVPLLRIQDSQNIDESRIDQDLTSITENRAVAGCNGDSDGHGNGTCYLSGSTHRNGKKWVADKAYFTDSSGEYYKSDWHHIEVHLQMNSIQNNKGIADGSIKYSYDGNVIIDKSNIMFRTAQNSDMRFNQFLIAPYMSNSPVDQTFWVDNLTVETK